MDKPREEFEEWFNKQMVLHISASNEIAVSLMWKAWLASRASIVVELPDTSDIQCQECADDVLSRCEKSLRSIGLSIKGE